VLTALGADKVCLWRICTVSRDDSPRPGFKETWHVGVGQGTGEGIAGEVGGKPGEGSILEIKRRDCFKKENEPKYVECC
jgi:hypothetical protein